MQQTQCYRSPGDRLFLHGPWPTLVMEGWSSSVRVKRTNLRQPERECRHNRWCACAAATSEKSPLERQHSGRSAAGQIHVREYLSMMHGSR
jgi:hypothetical protein